MRKNTVWTGYILEVASFEVPICAENFPLAPADTSLT